MQPHTIIKEALAGAGVPVHRTIPPANRTSASFLVAADLGGDGTAHPGLVERCTFRVEAWVGDGSEATRQTRCMDLADTARTLLLRAAQQGFTHGAAINFVGVMPRATLQPSGIDGVWRALFQVDLTIRGMSAS